MASSPAILMSVQTTTTEQNGIMSESRNVCGVGVGSKKNKVKMELELSLMDEDTKSVSFLWVQTRSEQPQQILSLLSRLTMSSTLRWKQLAKIYGQLRIHNSSRQKLVGGETFLKRRCMVKGPSLEGHSSSSLKRLHNPFNTNFHRKRASSAIIITPIEIACSSRATHHKFCRFPFD